MNDMTSQHESSAQQAASYDPDRLLDEVAKTLGAPNDIALSQKLNVSRTVLRHIRLRQLSITASFLMWLHDATGMQIQKLRSLLGDRRKKVRASGQYSCRTTSGGNA